MKNTKTITKWLMGAAVASALVLAVPHQAQAQVSFGVAVNGYPAPAYGYYGPNPYENWRQREYVEHERWEAERAAQWRHEEWEREHYRHDRDDWRDRDRDDRDRWHDRDGWRR